MSTVPQSIDLSLAHSGSIGGYRTRRERITSAALPATAAALAAAVMVAEQPRIAAGLLLGVLAVIGFALTRITTDSRIGTIVLVGRSPMASVIASTIEARQPHKHPITILRAATTAEAVQLLSTASCDEIVLAGTQTQFSPSIVDKRGYHPRLMTGAEKVEALLGRIPTELAIVDAGLSRIDRVRALDPNYALTKRGFDLLFSIGLAIVMLPVIPVLALAIKLDSRGPVLYSQTRVGLGGRVFRIYKFRTMRQDAEANGAMWAQARDPRVTRVGRFMRKTRIDEIPQVWNVIRGDMSVIGPRPERPEFTVALAREIQGYAIRQSVKPGLTGWAQVCYRYTSSIRDTKAKVEYDLYYVKHLSLAFDLRILFMTVKVVLGMKGQ